MAMSPMRGTGEGTLTTSSVSMPCSQHGSNLPMTLTLKSAAVGRKIEISTDGGTEYFKPQVDIETATMQVLSVASPISHIRFTGNIGDYWSVR